MNEKYAKLFSTIENTPQHIIELARRDTTDADGVAKHKNMDVVLHAAHLVDQIISSQLTAREKEALTIKLHSLYSFG